MGQVAALLLMLSLLVVPAKTALAFPDVFAQHFKSHLPKFIRPQGRFAFVQFPVRHLQGNYYPEPVRGLSRTYGLTTFLLDRSKITNL